MRTVNDNNSGIWLAALCLLTILSLASCGPSVKPTPREEIDTTKLSPQQQNDMAMVEFEKILDLITKYGRRNVLPQMEKDYNDIIRKYPDSFIAQESFWRLVELKMKDTFPPNINSAEDYREKFLNKYPDSRMIKPIDDSMSRFYYRNHDWERLEKVLEIHIKKFIETGKLEGPLFMFFYSEAKFNLKEYVEAKKGYKIVIKRFPTSLEASVSKDRLKEIDKIEKQSKEKEG